MEFDLSEHGKLASLYISLYIYDQCPIAINCEALVIHSVLGYIEICICVSLSVHDVICNLLSY